MSILDSLFKRFGYAKAVQPPAQYPDWLMATIDAERLGQPDPSIYRNQAELYQRVSWVCSAVSICASIAAGARLAVKRITGEDEEEITNHPFELLMQHPTLTPTLSKFELSTNLYSYLKLSGNAYWWLNMPEGLTEPQEIWSIPPYKIRPNDKTKELFVNEYLYDPGDGIERPIPAREIVHFKSFHPTYEFIGMGSVEPIADVARSDMAMVKWNNKLFDKNNGRLPGILAFKDNIADPQWDLLNKDILQASEKRNYMLLRGVGQGGVDWMQASNTLKDMEFTLGRQATKEEIYSVFAPGLSSMLDVSATEANSRTGKATLIEFGVWPSMCTVAEKITASIMPYYGEDLKAEYDDIRVTDRTLELQEQQAYSICHTIDETRKKYYQDESLADITEIEADDRGIALPAQIGLATPIPTDEPPAPVPTQLQPFVGNNQPGAPVVDPNAPKTPDTTGANQTGQNVDNPMQQDLAKWERKALKRFREDHNAVVEFESGNIPVDMNRNVMIGLGFSRTPEAIKATFAKYADNPVSAYTELVEALKDATKAALGQKGWVTINGEHVLIGEEGNGGGGTQGNNSGGQNNTSQSGGDGSGNSETDTMMELSKTTQMTDKQKATKQEMESAYKLGKKYSKYGYKDLNTALQDYNIGNDLEHDTANMSYLEMVGFENGLMGGSGNFDFVTAWRYGGVNENGRSTNFMEQRLEAGLSVMATSNGLETYDKLSAAFIGAKNKTIVYVSGFVHPHEKGGDGEPLILAPKVIKTVKP